MFIGVGASDSEDGGLSIQCLLMSALAVTAINVITSLFMSLGYSQSGIGWGGGVKGEAAEDRLRKKVGK